MMEPAKHEPDLTNITYRKIKVTENLKSPGVSFGKPSQTQEFYRNCHTGEKDFLKRTEFGYDAKGHENSQKVFDFQGLLL